LAIFVGGFEKEIGQEISKNQVRYFPKPGKKKIFFSPKIDSYLCLEIRWQYA